MKNYIENYIADSINTKNNIYKDENLISIINKSAEIIINSYKNNNKILIAGNGGSAADSQHIAAELVSKFCYERQALN
ncbi:SIS domain-containing protein, partial [bacterium]|nr:SIS domain-containing protein [bacterium]